MELMDNVIDFSNIVRNPNGSCNWKDSSGKICKFVYDNIEGEFTVIDYLRKERKLLVEYKNKLYKVSMDNIRSYNLESLGISNKKLDIKFKDDRWIDLSNLSLKPGKVIVVDWKTSYGAECSFTYKGLSGSFIIGNILDKNNIIVIYNNLNITIAKNDIIHANLCKVIGERNKDYKFQIGEILHQYRLDIEIIELIRITDSKGKTYKGYKCKCCTCDFEFESTENLIVHYKQGCPKCNHAHIYPGYNDIATTDPWMVKYFVNSEDTTTKSFWSMKKVAMQCPDCKEVRYITPSALYKLHSIGCGCHGTRSVAERLFITIFKQCNIDYIELPSGSIFPWIGLKRYDFFLPKYNCIVETHGSQHYLKQSIFSKSLEELLESDKYKRQLALDNGIEHYFEINCSKCYAVNTVYESAKELFQFLGINPLELNIEELYTDSSDTLIMNKLKEYLEEHPDSNKSKVKEYMEFNNYKYLKYMTRLTQKPSWYGRKELTNG